MLTRSAIVLAFAMVMAGCANEAPNLGSFATSSLAIADPVRAEVAMAPAGAVGEMPRKTMSDRVLAAIAFERVTGLKPDPSRFGE